MRVPHAALSGVLVLPGPRAASREELHLSTPPPHRSGGPGHCQPIASPRTGARPPCTGPTDSPHAGPASLPAKPTALSSSRTSGLSSPCGSLGPSSRISALLHHSESRTPSLLRAHPIHTRRPQRCSGARGWFCSGSASETSVTSTPPEAVQASWIALRSDKSWAFSSVSFQRVPWPPGQPHMPPGPPPHGTGHVQGGHERHCCPSRDRTRPI